ncbi:hypothetical protein MVEN_02213200 [Mycena venus]|uniref:F-box domain-containing protein n=1 Tax=Mycena venus TaxID=2733690 RepID=A0A8H7CFC4_9AGAR|nr:hypothetical protein MVEN_02213200 [Mycena venus]
MHRCLQIPEIVDMVFSQLDPRISSDPWPAATPFRDLSVVARTCTTFQGPALDYLWSSAPLERFLIRCAPSDIWDVEPNEYSWSEKYTIRLLRTIHVSDWDRARAYSPRVKHLWLRRNGWSLSKIFPTLSVALPEALFPNLQTLDWQPVIVADFHHIQIFLRPTLTRIVFIPPSDSASILSTLAAKCPKLTDISVPWRTQTASEADLEFLRGFQVIRRVTFPSVDQDAFQHLSRLATLESLTLDELPTASPLSPVADSPPFPVLRDLTLASEITPTTQFLRWCSGVPLNKFDMCLHECVTPDEMNDLFAAISAGFFAFLSHKPQHRQRMRGNGCVIDHLSLFGFDLDNDGFSDLALAWPQFHTPRATLSCLHSFAQHCPHLRKLTIALDATVVPAPEPDPRTRFHQRRLKALDVEHSPITNPFAVARFLSGVFPEVTRVMTHREYDDNDDDELEEPDEAIAFHNRWKDVQVMLPEFSAVREEGRMLAQQPSSM